MKKILWLLALMPVLSFQTVWALTPARTPTSNMKGIYFQIGSTYLSIPAAYFIYSFDRVPRKTDAVELDFFMPGFRPLGTVGEPRYSSQKERQAWEKDNHYLRIKLMEATDIKPYPDQNLVAISGNLVALYAGEQVNEKELRKILLSYILKEKPGDWDESMKFVKKFNIQSQFHGYNDIPRFNQPKLPAAEPHIIVLDVLKQALKNRHQEIRRRAVGQLGMYKTNLSEVTKLLIHSAQHDPAEDVRADSLRSLRGFVKENKSIPDIILEALANDKSSQVKHSASNALSGLEGVDSDRLIALLSNKDHEARNAAYRALNWIIINEIRSNKLEHYEQLSEESRKILHVLVTTIEGQPDHIKTDILMLLANSSLAVASPEFIEMTIYLLDYSQYWVKVQAIDTVGRLGELAIAAAPKLHEMISGSDYGLYQYATEALGKLQESGKPSLPRLIAQVGFECPGSKEETTLGKLSAPQPPPASDNLDESQYKLKECNDNTIKWVRVGAVRALGNLQVKTPEVEAAVLKALASEEHQLQYDAKNTALMLKIDSSKIIPIFLRSLKSQDHPIKLNAIEGLGGLGSTAKEALEAIRPYHNDPNPQLREAAIKATEQIKATADHHTSH